MEKSELLRQLKIDRSAPKPPSGGPWVWLLLVSILLGGGTWWAFKTLLPSPLPVKTALAVRQATGGSILDATGYVVARRQATVSAKITGKIAEVLIEEGQKVAEGQVLARLDQADARAQRDLAQAQLDAARSQLRDFQVQLAQAGRDLRRQEELVERRLVSVQAAEQARATVDSWKARLVTQQWQVAVAESALEVARVNLDNTVVRAPFAGVVVAKTAQPGEMVSPMSTGGFTRTGIGTLVDMDSLEIEVDVSESFIGRVKPGQPVKATLNAYPDWDIPADVIAIIPTADRSKATVKVRIALRRKDPRIVPEIGVRVAFLSGAETPPAASLWVPNAAIVEDNGKAAVFVADRGLAKKQAVTAGKPEGENRQVLEGLKGGERVILDPPATLKDGSPVAEQTGG